MKKISTNSWQIISVAISVAILILSIFSLYYVCHSTKYSKETADWVAKPKPLLKIFLDKSVEEEIQRNKFYNIPSNYYSPSMGMDSFRYGHTVRKIEIYLYNAGRVPIIKPTIWMDIKSNDSGYPFRLWEVETDLSNFSCDIFNHTLEWNGGYINSFNSYGVPDLIPNNAVPWLPHFKLSTINVSELKSFEIRLLGIKEDETGELRVVITAENVESVTFNIPLHVS